MFGYMSKSLMFMLLIVVSLSGCKSKKAKKYPLANVEDCKTMCKKITKCASLNVNKMTAITGAGDELRKHGLKVYSDVKKCENACKRNFDKGKKSSKDLNFYALFLGYQKECLKTPSCDEFLKCRRSKFKEAVEKYPLEDATVRRCEKVCKRIDTCANIIVPRLLGDKYLKLPFDKQAEVIKVQSDPVKCMEKCRYNFIRTKNGKNSKDDFVINFYKFANCISYTDCGQFSKCVTSQSDGE